MASQKIPYKYLVIMGLSLILTTCSVEKNTDSTRFYHSMTARYNIYFNGYESFKAGLIKVSNGYKDDYAEILKVFDFSDPSTVSLCSSDMERAIQKASKLISLKSITSKPEFKEKRDISEKEKKLLEQKEYNSWVDDSYLLIGKARFYKHEYSEAESVFTYCIAEANDPDIKIEASIWLARIYNEKKNYIESLRLLTELDLSGDKPKILRSMYYTTLADLFVKQKRYSEAVAPLANSLELIKGKRNRYRLSYLMAQIYERTGEAAKATTYYRAVIKMNPPYEVEFNARINIAGVFDINSGNPREIRRELDRMIRDPKNKDFQDQIYYALGNLAMREGNEAEALEFYRKSATAVSQNQNQKGRSYLAMADYFYKKPEYQKAGMYYDSAVFFLDQKHPDYLTLKAKSQNLNALVSELNIIQREDSLQRVAKMSENDRNTLISSIIAKIVKDESEGKTSKYSDQYNMGQYYENERRFQGNIDQEGKWYFYNQSALAFGRTEFKRRWGTRKVEDNWNRSNKARVTNTQASLNPNEPNQTVTDTTAAILDYKKPEFYLKNLPLSDSLMSMSNDKVAMAMLAAGKAYSERIGDQAKATETLESLISRFASADVVPEALYTLYKINKDQNSTKAETYRQKLIQNFPESEFARILSDPAYYEKKVAELKMNESLYEVAYSKYLAEKFEDAMSLCNDAVKKYPQSTLAPKFMLLHSYSLARITDERSFKEDLNILIKTWPGTPESTKAEELISYLNKKVPELKVEEDKVKASELYVADTSLVHMFALIISDPAFNVNQATFDVLSYNIDNYTNSNYRTQGLLIDNKYLMITVSGFAGYKRALEYYNAFRIELNVRNPKGARMISFVISEANLKVLNQDKDPERYQLFFLEKYMK